MANPKHKLDREEIMSFLLGELEEAETSRIESMFLSDPTYSEALEEAKSQLYQDYKSGRLTPLQSGRFEAKFLPNLDEDKKKFQAMLDRNEEKRRGGLVPVPTPTVATASSVSTEVASPRPPRAKRSKMLFVVGALVLLLAGLGAVLLVRGDDDSKKELSPIALSAFSVRGKSQVIILPNRATILVQLPLEASETSERFSIVAHHGDVSETWQAIRVGSAVETRVERASLADGRYDLELRRDDKSVVGYYSFRK